MHGTRIKWLASFVSSVMFSQSVLAGEYFDPGLLQAVNGNAAISDTSLLSQGYQPPGTYRVHIDVNGNAVLFSSVRFELNKEKQLIPCLSFKTYQKLGVDMSKVDSKAVDNETGNTCVPMEKQVPGIKTDFDFSKLTLAISIPQTVLRDESTEGIPQEEWDDGIPALISMYQLSGQQYLSRRSGVANSIYANLNNGINIGRWRLRNNSTVSNDEGWKNISSYVETAIRSLKSELTVGEASTPGDVFDSVLVRGVQLSSDDDMIPDQMTGFAPIIRGIAKSNARVTIRENGNVIYQRSVPPGPFIISDLSSVSNGGKLEVVVTEADGSESRSTVAYSSVPQLLRTWQRKYNLTAGHYVSGSNSAEDKPEILQASLSWGLPFNTTLYGGSQYHERYKAFSLGLGFDLKRLGGIAVDLTRSKARRNNSPEYTGDMVRLTYRNSIVETDTQIQLDNRYYLHDYLSFSDWADSETLFDDTRKRREYSMTVNQSVTDEHSFFATLSRTENTDNSISRMWQLGWNGSFKMVSFSLAYSMTRNQGDPVWDKQLALTLSVPFNEAFPAAQPMVNYTATSGLQGDLSNQVGITGKVDGHEDLSWNSQLSYASQHGQSDTQSGSLGLDYQGSYGEMNVTYNADQNQYISWNASGSVLAHRHGITAGRYSNGSMALVAIPGAPNVTLEGGQNVKTDSRGYALVPDMRSYHRNPLSIDPHASKDVDFVSTSTQVVPTKDAIVLANFTPISGRKVVLTVKHNGDFLPFGARARIEGNDETYYVGDQGQVYLNAAPDKGIVRFSWGDKQECSSPLAVPASGSTALRVAMISLDCH
ncbi:fimbrial biogenesis outer membrane usher protein [Cronobacter dublinensis]|nr:fimbrial biogenesis outer membrane usher protein [Cronobacter dublinensis]